MTDTMKNTRPVMHIAEKAIPNNPVNKPARMVSTATSPLKENR
jgi:hypothetical protein